jgi:hypothetical protein
VAFAKTLPYGGGPGFEPLWTPKILNANKRVPRGSPCLGHVAPPKFANKHATCPNHSPHVTSCQSTCLPHHLYHATSAYDPCHVSNCTDCTVSKFLPVWQIEQNVISHSYSVCLNPFKVRWVRDDEAYVPVHFEAILSTLNFEQNLIPWITPPHWEAFGPPKDYFQSI